MKEYIDNPHILFYGGSYSGRSIYDYLQEGHRRPSEPFFEVTEGNPKWEKRKPSHSISAKMMISSDDIVSNEEPIDSDFQTLDEYLKHSTQEKTSNLSPITHSRDDDFFEEELSSFDQREEKSALGDSPENEEFGFLADFEKFEIPKKNENDSLVYLDSDENIDIEPDGPHEELVDELLSSAEISQGIVELTVEDRDDELNIVSASEEIELSIPEEKINQKLPRPKGRHAVGKKKDDVHPLSLRVRKTINFKEDAQKNAANKNSYLKMGGMFVKKNKK